VSEQRYRDLYINTPGILHSIDKDLRLVEVSNHWLERMGYQRKEVLGRPFTDFMTANSRRTALEEIIPRFLATGSVRDVPYLCLYEP
jgi:PAS domain S-box-containing protein